MHRSFEAKCPSGVRKHDHIIIDNKEYTVIEVSVGGCSGKALIVATQIHTNEKLELLLAKTDMVHVCI